MIPCRLDIPTWRNADYTEQFPVLDGVTPVDLTGLTMTMIIRQYPTAPTALLTLGMSGDGLQGIFYTDVEGGLFDITINRSSINTIFDNLSPSVISDDIVQLSYDLIVSYPDGLNEIWMQGVMSISPGVTIQ